MAESLTAEQRLLKEGLDRMLGRLNPQQRQQLAFGWAHHAVTTLAPPHLTAAGLKSEAKVLAGLAFSDVATADVAKEKTKAVSEAADAARKKEEEEARGITEGPRTQAAKAASFALEAIKASLGEAGMKLKVTGPNQAPAARPVVDVDGNVSRAVLASKYAALLARMDGDAAAAEVEARHKQEVVAILKGPKKIG